MRCWTASKGPKRPTRTPLSEAKQTIDAQAAQLEAQRELIGELVAGLEMAEQLASVAGDWNLDEVEIDGQMMLTAIIEGGFHGLLTKAREVTEVAPLRQPQGGE